MKLRMPGSFSQVIIGLTLGMCFGLFFGEDIRLIEDIGTAYISLLQMSVLPYIVASLISGIGRLSVERAGQIGKAGGLLILLLWLISMLTVVMLPLAYPDWQASSFFSRDVISENVTFDPVSLYLPANPFNALAETVVPAVVVFSLAMGVALIGMPKTGGLILAFDNISKALSRITSAVVKLAPIGVFAITAVAFGTLEFAQLNRLQIYLWVYIAGWAILILWTLPVMLSGSTSLSYREVLRQSRLPVITALAVGSVLVVLPMIAERCKDLLKEHDNFNDETDATVDVLIPTAYSFPSAGTLLGLGFLLFAAWFAGSPLSLTQYPEFIITGLMTAFGSMNVALPFLLDHFRLPTDLFELFLLTSPVTGRLATGLAAMHAVVISLMGAYAVSKKLNWVRMLQIAAISLGITFILLTSLSYVLKGVIQYHYSGYDNFVSIEPLFPRARVKQISNPTPLSMDEQKRERLDIIKARGSLRIGYLPDRLPFAHRNELGQVVGFDMELMHILASDMDWTLEVVKLKFPDKAEDLIKLLDNGSIDILVGGIGMTPPRILKYNFTHSYLDGTVGFIVPDHRREDFKDLQMIRKMPSLKLAIPPNQYFREIMQSRLPNAEFIAITSIREYLKGGMKDVDAIASLAEGSAAWTMVYPDYTVAVPKELHLKTPLGFVLPQNQLGFTFILNNWLDLQERNDTLSRIYNHWILGKFESPKEPRWSIMHNVLHWDKTDENNLTAPVIEKEKKALETPESDSITVKNKDSFKKSTKQSQKNTIPVTEK